MRKTVSKMSLEKLVYYFAVLKFIALLSCCSLLVNFFGVEYLRTVSKLKKEEEKSFSCVYNPINKGGSRGRVQGVHTPPPLDDLRFSNTTGILQKKKLCGLLVLK